MLSFLLAADHVGMNVDSLSTANFSHSIILLLLQHQHHVRAQRAMVSERAHPREKNRSPLSNQQEMSKYCVCCLKVVP